MKHTIHKPIVQKNWLHRSTLNNLPNKMNHYEEMNHIMAHNLRGPLANIIMLSADNGVFSKEEAMQLINECSNLMLNELNAMLEVSHIQLNENIPYDNCNPGEITDKIIRQLRGQLLKSNTSVVVNFETGIIRYPRIYLESILYNLINNAIKYSAANPAPEIRISSRYIMGATQISVKDNGVGIDMEKYGNKVFGFRNTFHQGYESKGIGLFITKKQIESLGGMIEVISQVNQGCEFIVTL